jgi:hypothetical protein
MNTNKLDNILGPKPLQSYYHKSNNYKTSKLKIMFFPFAIFIASHK